MKIFRPLLAALTLTSAVQVQATETITLRVHHFLPPTSTAHTKFIEPWCAKINKESAGRLKCQIYPSMQLGGTPPQLFDQAKDGVADIVWTVPTYQAARFSVSEVFELPFMSDNAEKSSRALWNFATKYATDEYKAVKPLVFHMHDGAHIHTRSKQIKTLADFHGLKMRAPTRLSTRFVAALGAIPVPMPAPLVPESLSKGVIDGAVLPWELLPSLKIEEIVKFHTESGPGLPKIANAIFVLAMNPAKYNSLPPDLKKVIDGNSGPDTSAWVGRIWDEAQTPARKVAADRKNVFYTLSAGELKQWQKAADSVANEWVKEVSAKGYDGQKLLAEARATAR
jgi:TRAP-type transport system periplasmic protein